MMSYKDMTFCPFQDCDNFENCERALSEEVIQDAIVWWGDQDAPIAQFMDKPSCFSLVGLIL